MGFFCFFLTPYWSVWIHVHILSANTCTYSSVISWRCFINLHMYIFYQPLNVPMDLEIIICCCCLVLIYLKPGLIFHLWQDVSHSEEQDKNANLSSSDIIQVVTLEKVSLIDVILLKYTASDCYSVYLTCFY